MLTFTVGLLGFGGPSLARTAPGDQPPETSPGWSEGDDGDERARLWVVNVWTPPPSSP